MANLTTIIRLICATVLFITGNCTFANIHATFKQYSIDYNTQCALTTQTDCIPQGRLLKQQAFNKETKHHPIQRDYGYDPAANLLLMGDDLTKPQRQVKGNRLKMQGDKKFEYDARGNLTQETSGKEGKLQKQFVYNLNNQLVKVQSNPRDQVIEFKYDSLGRRVEKRDAFGTTTFLWADNQLMQEQRHNNKKTYLYEPGTFRPLAQIQDGNVYHYHLDHLGTPRELTNNDGKIVWKAKYKTYGNLALKEVEEVENNIRFQGQYYDPETGLHYNRFRYYSPESGQFINQDPIGLLGGLNHYQYVTNPVQWVDPWGLCKEEYYRTMSSEHFDRLNSTKRIPGTGETSISPNKEFAQNYRGVTVKFEVKQGTMQQLAAIGVSDGAALTREIYPGMPEGIAPWNDQYARFKTETLKPSGVQQVNIQLGNGTALNTFNDNIISYEEVSRQTFSGKKARGRVA